MHLGWLLQTRVFLNYSGEASEFREGPKECSHRLTAPVTDLVPFGPVCVRTCVTCP